MNVDLGGLIVSVSGIRGIVGESLMPESAARFAAALGHYLHGGRIVVSRDSRPSGEMLKHAVFSGLFSAGCRIEDIGITPTPTVGVAVRNLGAAGAIQITASHNPSPWNGLKLFGSDGAVLSAERGNQVRKIFESGTIPRATWDKISAEVQVPPDVFEDHMRAVLDQVSVARIASKNFNVFLDANGGAGGPYAARLLQELGCAVVQHNCEMNGVFTHEPEPTPENLAETAGWVKQTGCAIGFALDPDADRLVLIDETGTCVSEELTLALAVKYRLRHDAGPVVVNMSTSRVIQDLADRVGAPFSRSAVGEANVVERMRGLHAVIGGEGNGGIIDPRVGWVRDPYIGMTLILALMAEDERTLTELIAELPSYSMLKTKYVVAKDRLSPALSTLESRWPEAAVNKLDGLRIDGSDWWLHVRPSNTEPVVRVIAEAPSRERAQELCDEAGSMLTR